jgi:hypothetical protein
VIDAFSSDAIPLHLVTSEAFGVYRRKLEDDGLLLMHISNRFIDLRPVVAALAERTWHDGNPALGYWTSSGPGSALRSGW